MDAIDELAAAAMALPEVIRESVRAALASGDFTIGAGSWQSELALCPVAAGAVTANVWQHGAIVPGADEWGTPEGPSPAVEDFAAWFDICAEDEGLPLAIAAARSALDERVGARLLAFSTTWPANSGGGRRESSSVALSGETPTLSLDARRQGVASPRRNAVSRASIRREPPPRQPPEPKP